jgi:DoxX-like protein
MAGRPAAAGLLAGRLLSAFIFVHDGWSIIGSYSGAAAYMQRFGVPVMLLPAVIALVSLTIWASTVALDVFCWHRPENLGSATASAAIRGYNRRAGRIDGMPARDP